MHSLSKHPMESKASETLASIVKRLGNPASTMMLNSSCSSFSIPEVDGVIGYRLIRNCAVAIGDPVCLPKDIPRLTEAFQAYCQKSAWSIVYLLTSKSFAHWAINNGCPTLIEPSEELILDPANFQQ